MSTATLQRTTDDPTVTDLFCGAGGSSIGAHRAGFEVVVAANHWQLAIETHGLNFPDTDHKQADISNCSPRSFPRTLVLWASPECTKHSQARGKKKSEQAEQEDLFTQGSAGQEPEVRSRATMWDVVRFAEHHRYRYVVVENVTDVLDWVLFRAWWEAMRALGYEGQVVSLNSMHAPSQGGPRAPQSRDRVYIVWWRAGERRPDVDPRPEAWCAPCGQLVNAIQVFKNGRRAGKYRAQYVYRCPRVECRNSLVEPITTPAADIIDWHLPGQRIGDRKDPLSDKTMARIKAGLVKYARPVTFEAAGNTFARVRRDGTLYSRSWPVDEPTAAVTCSETRALVVPAGGTWNDDARPVDEPLRTRTTRETDGLLVPVEGREGKPATHVTTPMRTMTTRAETALCVPYTRTGVARRVDEPMHTVTTVDPAGVAFIAELRGGRSGARRVTDPVATVTASGTHHGLCVPQERAERALIQRHNTARGNPAQMLTPATEPARTVTTKGHQSIVEWTTDDLPDPEDCLFRMLNLDELGRAMAFGDGQTYKLAGTTKRDRVKLLGNGVTPPAAEFLLRAIHAAASA